MKFKTRLYITFLTIVFLPLALTLIAFMGIGTFMSNQELDYGIEGDYTVASEPLESLGKSTEATYTELLNQINDIFDLSQMEMERMKIIKVPYNTKELFSELSDLIRLRMERKGLKFSMNVDSSLPAVLNGDVRRMKQVLLNLLDNALKYTEKGSVELLAEGELCGEQEVQLKRA